MAPAVHNIAEKYVRILLDVANVVVGAAKRLEQAAHVVKLPVNVAEYLGRTLDAQYVVLGAEERVRQPNELECLRS